MCCSARRWLWTRSAPLSFFALETKPRPACLGCRGLFICTDAGNWRLLMSSAVREGTRALHRAEREKMRHYSTRKGPDWAVCGSQVWLPSSPKLGMQAGDWRMHCQRSRVVALPHPPPAKASWFTCVGAGQSWAFASAVVPPGPLQPGGPRAISECFSS